MVSNPDQSVQIAGGFTPEQLDMTVQDFVSAYCIGRINRELPAQFAEAKIREVIAKPCRVALRRKSVKRF